MNRRALARQAAGAKVAVPAKEESDASGVENVSRKLEMQLEKGDFYGALQMYKTLFMRHLKGEPDTAAQEKAIELALDAALNLVKHDQNTAAAEMANLLVGVYTDHHWKVDETSKGMAAAVVR
jgi:golgi to ER traffic protein 4